MSPTRLVVGPVLGLGVIALMGSILLGGCPQPQTPTPLPVEEPNTPAPSDQTGPGRQDRPIPTPPVEPNEPAPPTPPPDTSGDGTSNTGGGGTATFSVRWNAPLTPLAMRTGTSVDLVFKLSDTQSVVTSAELVVARDNDADGQPDGNPVAAKSVSVSAGSNTITYNTNQAAGLLNNGFGRFVLGLRLHSSLGEEQITYAPGRITIDGIAPTVTWVSPTSEALVNPQDWQVQLQTTDNSQHTVRVVLDNDTNPANGYAGILIADTEFGSGTSTLDRTVPLSIAPGTYYYYVIVTDGIDPPTTMYAKAANGNDLRLMVTNRLIGTYDLNRLASPPSGASEGAILQGFNFNDLAGSSMAGVPDITGDGKSELLIASRFGKPFLVNSEGIGWGEAYMIYGSGSRLRGISQLNSVGRGSIPGLTFPGIRAPMDTTWTEGLSDVTVIPDMDGDSLPELVFSFPRVESVSLANVSPVQHPDLFSDYPGLGSLEYDAYDYLLGAWVPNTAQFTRGGIVIVSSHSPMLKDPSRLNRKGNRIVDLAEVGQVFDDTRLPEYEEFIWGAASASATITGCDPNDPTKESSYTDWRVEFDNCFEDQGPGGFDNHYSAPQYFGLPELVEYPPGSGDYYWNWVPDPDQPPLANIRFLPYFLEENPNDPNYPPLALGDPCGNPACVFTEYWTNYLDFPVEHVLPAAVTDPDPYMHNAKGWHASFLPGPQSGEAVWTGFCGHDTARVIPAAGGNECGARILGQRREDRFGSAVGADGNYLYISSPQRTALKAGDNVPALEGDRAEAGVVYQLRTNAHPFGEPYTVTQLWIEPGALRILDPNDPNYPSDPNDPNAVFTVPAGYPYIDKEIPDRQDTAMPTPHQYIIETIGFTRGGDDYWPDLSNMAPDPPPPSLLQAPAAGANGTPIADRRWLVDYTGTWSYCDVKPKIEDYWGVPSITIDDSPYWPHYSAEAAEYYVDRTNQIVGPHNFARLSFVRGLGDVNDDDVADFALGSQDVDEDFANPQQPSGQKVGAVFIVFNRPVGLEGDYLLDRMALAPGDDNRVHGVLLRGSTADEEMGRVFDDAHDFDGNGVADVVVGAEGYDSNRGQAIVILGSSTIESPVGGWTVDDILSQKRGIRFTGEAQGDLAGANVAGVGDVDGDGLADLLIAAPGAAGGNGAAYLIYGAAGLAGEDVSLSLVGTLALPGAKLVGRAAGDKLGGGQIGYPADTGVTLNPNGDPTTVYSHGVVGLGDIDGDGYADFAISAMLANPNNRSRAGEVYILYGRGDR
jgi:hypothetical protein